MVAVRIIYYTSKAGMPGIVQRWAVVSACYNVVICLTDHDKCSSARQGKISTILPAPIVKRLGVVGIKKERCIKPLVTSHKTKGKALEHNLHSGVQIQAAIKVN